MLLLLLVVGIIAGVIIAVAVTQVQHNSSQSNSAATASVSPIKLIDTVLTALASFVTVAATLTGSVRML